MADATISEKLLQEFPYADKDKLSRRIMIHFIIAMMFPIGSGFYFFGIAMVRTVLACTLFCVVTERVLNWMMKKDSTLGDLTAIATGLIIATNMRPGIGLYPLLLTCIVGIAVGKMIFGGVGFNPVNPAVVGRLLPVAGFPALWATAIRPTIPNLMEYAGLTYWEASLYNYVRDVKALPFYNKVTAAQPAYAPYSFSDQLNTNYDVLSGTTYLETVKNWYKSGVMPEGMAAPVEFFDYWTLFFGNMPGTLGETGKWAILLGFLYLVITRVISPLVPILVWIFMGVFGWIFGATRLGPLGVGPLGYFAGDPFIWILAGGAFLGSVYMETDPVSSPRSTQAKVLYSLLFVSIVTAIRLVFSFPEGVSFALLGSNLMIPFIDKLCNPQNKYAKEIKKTLITIAIITVVAITAMATYKTFFSTPLYKKQVMQTLPNQQIGEVLEMSTTDGDIYYAIYSSNGNLIGHAYTVSALGYGDNYITMMVAIADDKILGMSALDVSTQTEGVGQLVAEEEFLKQFIGKTREDVPSSSLEWSEIDIISGATYTSDAVAGCIENAFILNDQVTQK